MECLRFNGEKRGDQNVLVSKQGKRIVFEVKDQIYECVYCEKIAQCTADTRDSILRFLETNLENDA